MRYILSLIILNCMVFTVNSQTLIENLRSKAMDILCIEFQPQLHENGMISWSYDDYTYNIQIAPFVEDSAIFYMFSEYTSAASDHILDKDLVLSLADYAQSNTIGARVSLHFIVAGDVAAFSDNDLDYNDPIMFEYSAQVCSYVTSLDYLENIIAGEWEQLVLINTLFKGAENKYF